MYRLVEPEDFFWRVPDLKKTRPVATLRDEHGGEVQIAVDDHCYVFLLRKAQEQVASELETIRVKCGMPNTKGIHVLNYTALTHIFPELLEVIRQLPPLPSCIDASGPRSPMP